MKNSLKKVLVFFTVFLEGKNSSRLLVCSLPKHLEQIFEGIAYVPARFGTRVGMAQGVSRGEIRGSEISFVVFLHTYRLRPKSQISYYSIFFLSYKP
jgi:hypothetical protein